MEVENERRPIALAVNKSPAVSTFIRALDKIGGLLIGYAFVEKEKKKQESRELLSEGWLQKYAHSPLC